MNKKRDHRAAAYLLLGVGAAGRALLAVPESVNLAELSLSVLMLCGALLLTRDGLQSICCITLALLAELALCGSWVQGGGWLPAVLRLADLWLLMGAASGALNSSRRTMDDLHYTRNTRLMLLSDSIILVLHTVLRLVSLAMPDNSALAAAMSISFVVFSVVLLWFTVLMIKAYSALRQR